MSPRNLRPALDHEAVARALWGLMEITMCAYPAGLSCVRIASRLPDDCDDAFGEPRCPQCRISAWLLEHGQLMERAQKELRP